jgi:uncharacterized iron-regulated protein
LQRDLLRTAALSFFVVAIFAACASGPRPEPWEQRLRGDAIVLLGEVHDNAEQHRLRLALLRRAFDAGWRPAIAMEQLDREQQAEIERARRERPGDAQHVLDLAAAHSSGWSWAFYRPFIELALAFDVPLIAANLSSADATRIVRGGYAAVFDAASLAELGLDRPITPDWQTAQESEIDAGHCHALPRSSWPAMARVQFARDAVMAAFLRGHASGVVLLAGNGHVRRDLGVPRWLSAADQARLFAVGFLEEGAPKGLAADFDVVVHTARAERSDPCAAFAPREHRSPRSRPQRAARAVREPAAPRRIRARRRSSAPAGAGIPLESRAAAGI